MSDDSNGDESDDSLDARGERFDPLRVLYSPRSRLASIDAPIYDNVSKFESVLKKLNAPVKKDQSTGSSEVTAGPSRRRFLPHQEPVPARRRKWKQKQNIISRMQNMLGPLGMLYECMENRNRVRVYTRNERGIRGHMEAYVAAFDKHWNLALEDCYEVWSRKVKRKAPALGADAVKVEAAENDVPKVTVRKIEGKMETLERHVPQMLLRGEQVAIIVKIN